MTVEPAKAQFADAATPTNTFAVMFNPASLKVTLTNKLQDQQPAAAAGAGGASGHGASPPAAAAHQNTQATTTKLETELVFDTTQDGGDVREWSKKLKDLAKTPGPDQAPPRVVFTWGRFTFSGVIESLVESIDFWSSEGVPLRSTVQLVLQGIDADGVVSTAPATASLNQAPIGGRGTTDVATAAGDPRAGRQLAAANGIENMRMAGGGAVAVSAGVELKAAAGFSLSAGASAGIGIGASAGFGAGASAGASAGFGAGASAGFGAGASAGFGAGASAGFGAGASAGFGAGASAGFGASATAGLSASQGAFAGLGVSKTATTSVRLDPGRLLPPPGAAVAVGSGAQFDVTGRVSAAGSSGLSAEVRGGVRFG